MKKSRSFRFYFALIFGILIALICTIISIVAYQISSKEVKSEIGSSLSESSYIIADTLDVQLHAKYGKLNILREIESIKEGTDIATITNSLNLLKINFIGFAWLGYSSYDGTILAATSNLGVGEDISGYPFYQYGIRNRYSSDSIEDYTFARQILGDSAQNTTYITFSAPVYSKSGTLTGLLCAYIEWDWINEFIDSLLTSLKSRSELDVLIIDTNDTIIFGPTEMIGTSLETESIQKSRYHLNSWIVETFPDNIRYLTGYVRSDGYADFSGLGWTILVRQPYKYAFNSTYTLLYIILIVGIICVFVFAIIGWYLAGLLIKPLENIAISANQIRLGEQSEIPYYQGIKDIEILSLSLTHLITSLTNTESALASMETKALHDSLTNLPNRSGFENHVTMTLSRLNRQNDMLTFLYLDLDGFKFVNDTYGHPVGDLLLIQVGKRLKNSVRTNELVARFGGDEFAIVIQTSKENHRKQVITVCDRILESLNRPFVLNGDTANIGCSIGCSTWPNQSLSVDELINFADEALYEAKRNGKNQYFFYDEIIGKVNENENE